MAITLATAALAASAISAGSQIYAAGQANDAANKQIDANNQATQQSLALQKEVYDSTVKANAPFTSAGYDGLDAYMSHIGLGGSGPTVGAVNAAQPSGVPASSRYATQSAGGSPQGPTVQGQAATQQAPDYAQYVETYPDVAAEFARLQSTPEGRDYLAQQGVNDVNDFGALHYQTNGQSEGRQLNTTAAPASTYGADLSQIGTRPTFDPRQTYTRPEAVGLPTAPSLSADRYQASPGYEWQLSEGNRAINAQSAARGLGQSSGAIKSALTYSQGLADQDYQQWVGNELNIWQTDINRSIAQNNIQNQNFESDRGYGTSVYDADRAFSTGQYESDRNYLTDAYNTQTGNLLALTNIGQASANNTAAAGSNYAANSGNILRTSANNLSDAYGQIGATNAGLATSLGGLAGNVLTNLPGGSGPVTPIPTVSANDNVLRRASVPTSTGTLQRAPYIPVGSLTY